MSLKERISRLRVPQRIQYEIQNLLYGEPDCPHREYDPLVHPKALLDYFSEPFRALERYEAERVEDRHGRVEYVQPPAPQLPTIAGFAAKMELRRETLWAWAKLYTEFGHAMDVAKSMQEHLVVVLASGKAYDPRFASMLMKNYGDWVDKVEQNLRASVTLNFDAQDREA